MKRLVGRWKPRWCYLDCLWSPQQIKRHQPVICSILMFFRAPGSEPNNPILEIFSGTFLAYPECFEFWSRLSEPIFRTHLVMLPENINITFLSNIH